MNLPPPVHDNPPSPSTSEDNEDNEDGNRAMKAAMGFSSFGTQPPAKRAKTGHVTLSGGKSGAAMTGGNALPLGAPRLRGKVERALGDEGEDGRGGVEGMGGDVDIVGKEGGGVLEERQGEVLRRSNHGGEGMSAGCGGKDATGIPSAEMGGDDGRRVVSSSSFFSSGEGGSASARDGMKVEDAGSRAGDTTSRTKHMIPKVQGFTADGFEGHSWAEWKRGVRDERGDLVIFDGSFVEDPWVKLRGKG
ncbi:MAG: hypothetical protein Q9182_002672 [Xanthomendoza sp. 2 TL-2023]